jgi:putative ATP-binding cassette transporter
MRSTLATVWRIAAPYFRSEDKRMAWALLVVVILMELASVGLTVLFNRWNNGFYNAVQNKDYAGFFYYIGYFSVLASFWIPLQVYQTYLNSWLQIRWRNWMTQNYLGDWLSHANHYRMQLKGDAADNPDQRIAEDIQLFINRTLALGIGLLNAVVTVISFVYILWELSDKAPLHVFGRDIPIPGYLVWGALIYSMAGTLLTHWIGWPLVGLNFQQQQFEADFRFNLIRTREKGEQIALLHGENVERERLLARFQRVVANWLATMQRTKKLTAFTASQAQVGQIYPYLLMAPAYFADKIQLGALFQTADAYDKVQKAFSFFISSYTTLAEWRAIVERLDGFEASIENARAMITAAGIVRVNAADGGAIELKKLLVDLPNGAPLVTADDFSFRPGETTLVGGPSGSGKSTLFRAIAGIWPFATGTVAVPAKATLMMLPQSPYLPIGSLHAAVAYPVPASTIPAERLAEVLTAVGLPALASRMEEEAHWDRMLSLGEQQRLGLARALLLRPQYLFLDEATASLDEASEAALYHLLERELPATTIVSIGHRSTLQAFHRRKVTLVTEGERHALRDAVAESA